MPLEADCKPMYIYQRWLLVTPLQQWRWILCILYYCWLQRELNKELHSVFSNSLLFSQQDDAESEKFAHLNLDELDDEIETVQQQNLAGEISFPGSQWSIEQMPLWFFMMLFLLHVFYSSGQLTYSFNDFHKH